MGRPYQCPICHDNRTRFTFIYKLAQDVQLDPETGDVVYEADELEAILRPDGLPDLEVRCKACNYTSSERAFIPRHGGRAKRTQAQAEPMRRAAR